MNISTLHTVRTPCNTNRRSFARVRFSHCATSDRCDRPSPLESKSIKQGSKVDTSKRWTLFSLRSVVTSVEGERGWGEPPPPPPPPLPPTIVPVAVERLLLLFKDVVSRYEILEIWNCFFLGKYFFFSFLKKQYLLLFATITRMLALQISVDECVLSTLGITLGKRCEYNLFIGGGIVHSSR